MIKTTRKESQVKKKILAIETQLNLLRENSTPGEEEEELENKIFTLEDNLSKENNNLDEINEAKREYEGNVEELESLGIRIKTKNSDLDQINLKIKDAKARKVIEEKKLKSLQSEE